MNTKHLSIFLPSLRGGGAERAMLRLACGVAAHGTRVDLVLARAEGPYVSTVPETIRIIDFGTRRILSSLSPLRKYLQKERPHVLLSAMGHTNLVALWARRLARVPTRLFVSERSTLSRTDLHATKAKEKLLPLFMRWFYPWADGIVAVSHGVADDLAKTTHLRREDIKVIYNPVVTPELLQQASEPLDHPWFVEGAPPVFLGVGRLTAQKDFFTLIQAFARVRTRFSSRLLILGEGEDRPALEMLVRDLGIGHDVDMPGFTPNPFAYISRATAFVLSSAWEGLPNVLIEAMACGCPVISTACQSGPEEILDQGRYGALVPVGDDKALSEAMLAMLEKPTARDHLQSRALEFSAERSIQNFLAYIYA